MKHINGVKANLEILEATPTSRRLQAQGAAQTVSFKNFKMKPSLENGQATAVDGVLSFSQLIVHLKPGTKGRLRLQVANESNHFGFYDRLNANAQFIDIKSRNCISGEELTAQGSCQ